MKRLLVRTGIGLAALILLAGIALGAAVRMRWDRTFEDVPLPDIHASTDSAVIARGRYLAYGPAACAYCHLPKDRWDDLADGARPPLSGGLAFHLPFGTIHSPNLTPHPVTGIGSYTDGQLARMLRHNIRPDGRAAFPFMEYQMMSDADIRAIISFLRSQPPVPNDVPDRDLNFLGKALFAFAFGPQPPRGDPPKTSPPPGPTFARGRYLARNLAGCMGCHTRRDPRTGAYVGPEFAGGFRMPIAGDPPRVLVTPNLTPDPVTGVMAAWTEEQFVARFKEVGKVVPESHMPWAAFAQIREGDLRGIYRYLDSLEPVRNETGPVIQPAGG